MYTNDLEKEIKDLYKVENIDKIVSLSYLTTEDITKIILYSKSPAFDSNVDIINRNSFIINAAMKNNILDGYKNILNTPASYDTKEVYYNIVKNRIKDNKRIYDKYKQLIDNLDKKYEKIRNIKFNENDKKKINSYINFLFNIPIQKKCDLNKYYDYKKYEYHEYPVIKRIKDNENYPKEILNCLDNNDLETFKKYNEYSKRMYQQYNHILDMNIIDGLKNILNTNVDNKIKIVYFNTANDRFRFAETPGLEEKENEQKEFAKKISQNIIQKGSGIEYKNNKIILSILIISIISLIIIIIYLIKNTSLSLWIGFSISLITFMGSIGYLYKLNKEKNKVIPLESLIPNTGASN